MTTPDRISRDLDDDPLLDIIRTSHMLNSETTKAMITLKRSLTENDEPTTFMEMPMVATRVWRPRGGSQERLRAMPPWTPPM